MKKAVALIFGSQSAEHDVSVLGYEYIFRILKDSKYKILSVYIDQKGDWFVLDKQVKTPVFPCRFNGKGMLKSIDNKCFYIDVAIPILHGDGGESGEIQGILKSVNIAFVGADSFTSAICLDKHYTKCIASDLNIPVTDWVSFSSFIDAGEALKICLEKLVFPMIIKPRRLGSSLGIYIVKNQSEFLNAYPKAGSTGNGLVIVENLLESKRELECAFYQALGTVQISPPGEVISNGFYGYNEKYLSNTSTVALADIDKDTKLEIAEYNRRLSDACGLRHLGRIDYFLTEKGVLFNEINTFPGFTSASLYPKLLNAMGISTKDALAAFIEDAAKC